LKVAILTDAWYPQVNGVVTSIYNIAKHMDDEVRIISPLDFKFNISLPTYKEIKQPIDIHRIFGIMDKFDPEYIHISTPEGMVGIAGRMYCRKRNRVFTTSYHTKIPEYMKERFESFPISFGYMWERMAHRRSKKIFVSTNNMKDELINNGFENEILSIGRGVDFELFDGKASNVFDGMERPILLYVGRVSIEKNLEDFLECEVEGTKVVVGNGPTSYFDMLRSKYCSVVFTGYKFGKELASMYASADVFVFPSYTDTFGLVLLESIASGTPIVVFDGKCEVVEHGINGLYSNKYSLKESVSKCMSYDRSVVRSSSLKWSWQNCSKKFMEELI